MTELLQGTRTGRIHPGELPFIRLSLDGTMAIVMRKEGDSPPPGIVLRGPLTKRATHTLIHARSAHGVWWVS